VADSACPGDVFALVGDLGSGKTTFAKGFAKALGIKKEITSPTFVISKVYPLSGKNFSKLIHVDCYRLSGEEDAEAIGLSEYFQQKDSIILLEWPENIKDALPKKAKRIYFKYIDKNTREINIK